MNIVGDITCTSGGACTSDATTPRAILARAIVGMRTGNSTLINEAKSEIDRVDEAIYGAKSNVDEKWPERNLGPIAVAANIINYRPLNLTTALRAVLYDWPFEGTNIKYMSTHQLPNKPSWGRWSVLTSAYIMEDWTTVNQMVQTEAKALGEPNWGGSANTVQLELTGLGNDDNWQTLQPGGKSNPLLVMPAGINYSGHGVGGLYLADQYRAANGPQWPPSYTDYTFEGRAPNIAISWAAYHLGWKDALKWGNYALLRSMLFSYSTHDGKTSWPVGGNDVWQNAALMTWVKLDPTFNSGLPSSLKPEPDAPVTWPLPVTAGGDPGRGIGWMYATHYARLVL